MTTASSIFESWGRLIESSREDFTGLTEKYLWTVPGPEGGSWLMCATADRPIRSGLDTSAGPRSNSAICRIEIDTENLLKLASGELNPQSALLHGKMHVSGPTADLMELNFILDRLIPEFETTGNLQ